MARTADHQARRRQVAEAVRDVMAEAGFDGVTIAGVAARAGISVGLVQHYFPSKDELLLHTYREAVRASRARIDERIAGGRQRGEPIRTVLLDAFAEMLPLDETRRAEYRISQAFLGRAFDDPALAEIATQGAAAIRREVATTVENGKECGEVEPGVDSEQSALDLIATATGLAVHLYQEPGASIGPHSMPEAVRVILGGRMAEVFTGECRHYDDLRKYEQ